MESLKKNGAEPFFWKNGAIFEKYGVLDLDFKAGDIAGNGAGFYALTSKCVVFAKYSPPYPGRYRLRVEAGAQQAGTEFAKMQVELDSKTVKVFDVKAKPNAMQMHSIEVDLEAREYELAAAFINVSGLDQSGINIVPLQVL